MTFEECYNSGLRFRGHCFDPDIYWRKRGNTRKHEVEQSYEQYPDHRVDYFTIVESDLIRGVNFSDIVWSIHPEDKRIMDYNRKLQSLLKEDTV